MDVINTRLKMKVYSLFYNYFLSLSIYILLNFSLSLYAGIYITITQQK